MLFYWGKNMTDTKYYSNHTQEVHFIEPVLQPQGKTKRDKY